MMSKRFARPISAALCGFQILAIAGSVVAATYQIESICGTGPAFSVSGLLVAFSAKYTRVRWTALFGLSTVAISLFLFALIASLNWSPGDARRPVPCMLFAYEFLSIPAGLRAMYQTLTLDDRSSALANSRQFSIKSLLMVTFAVALACIPVRWVHSASPTLLTTIAIVLALITVACLAIVVVLAVRLPRRLLVESESAEPVLD